MHACAYHTHTRARARGLEHRTEQRNSCIGPFKIFHRQGTFEITIGTLIIYGVKLAARQADYISLGKVMFSGFSIRLFMSQTYTKARVFRKKDKKKKLAANKAYSILNKIFT